MAESVDCSEFCRLCLVKEQVNTHIFEDLGELQQIHVKITACLPIKVAYEDSLPKRICDDCIYKLDQQYQFWNTTINSEKQLKQWLGILDVPIPKQEPEKSKIKKEKEQEQTVTKTRPRRNARRKAAQNVRQAAAAAIAASDSDAGIGGDDMDIDHFAKEENDSDEDYHDNTESLEENTYTNVGLDSEEQGEAEAGPSGLQKSAAAPSANSGSDNGGAGFLQIELEESTEGCSRTFKRKKYLDQHNKAFHNLFCCEICLETFSNLRDLRMHQKQHFYCKKCKLCFRNEKQFLSHSHVSTKFKCPECPERIFKSQVMLEVHVISHYKSNNIPVEEHKCQLCNKTYTHELYLKRHLKWHAGLTKRICYICGKTVNSNNSLVEHLNLHNGIKPFTCTICNTSFVKRNSLRVHMYTHNVEKPFKCDEPDCHKSFIQTSALIRHINRYHPGKKSF